MNQFHSYVFHELIIITHLIGWTILHYINRHSHDNEVRAWVNFASDIDKKHNIYIKSLIEMLYNRNPTRLKCYPENFIQVLKLNTFYAFPLAMQTLKKKFSKWANIWVLWSSYHSSKEMISQNSENAIYFKNKQFV